MHFGVGNVSDLGHNDIVKPIDFHPFHAFQKKSQKTPAREIALARQRLREVLDAKIGF
jgi:hypothetical protein